jgi:hypothetical protein
MGTSGKRGYEQLFADVRAILNDHDPMGLISLGAPEHEYEPEVGSILPRLSGAEAPAHVEAIVAEEFLHWFDQTLPPEIVTVVAADVWAAYGRSVS